MMNITADSVLQAHGVFGKLSPHTTKTLAARATYENYARGETLFKPSDPWPGVIVVLSGIIKSSKTNASGKEQVFSVYEAGSMLGLRGLIGRTTALTKFTALQSGEYLVYPYKDMREAIARDGDFALAILGKIIDLTEAMRERIESLSLKDAHTRLCVWLNTWLEKHYHNKQEAFQAVLPYTQSEIAAQVGTVREVISRSFARLEKDGVLVVSGKRVSVLSRSRLKEAAKA